jgi:orotidine-5'-phosphate decarboxylase
MPAFTERLRTASEATQSLLCVGLDPDPARLPVPDAVEFNRSIVSATADLVCAYKPNLAFYEAMGRPGFKALEKTVKYIRGAAPHCIIIGDCKRGDIDASAAAYATAMFDVWGFDAVTVNPWGGMDTVEPWLTNAEKGAFIWCRGSNRGAADIQDLAVSGVGNPEQPLYLSLARRAQQRASQGNLGLVVGATASQQLADVRGSCPDLPILIPGIGAQGGDLADSVRCGVDVGGRLAIINASRSVIYASSGAKYAEAARRAASTLRDEISATLNGLGLGWT